MTEISNMTLDQAMATLHAAKNEREDILRNLKRNEWRQEKLRRRIANFQEPVHRKARIHYGALVTCPESKPLICEEWTRFIMDEFSLHDEPDPKLELVVWEGLRHNLRHDPKGISWGIKLQEKFGYIEILFGPCPHDPEEDPVLAQHVPFNVITDIHTKLAEMIQEKWERMEGTSEWATDAEFTIQVKECNNG